MQQLHKISSKSQEVPSNSWARIVLEYIGNTGFQAGARKPHSHPPARHTSEAWTGHGEVLGGDYKDVVEITRTLLVQYKVLVFY